MSLWFFVHMHNHTRNIANNIKPQFFFPHHSVVVNVCVVNILANICHSSQTWSHVLSGSYWCQGPQMLRLLGSIIYVFICCGLIHIVMYVPHESEYSQECPWNTVLSSVSLCFTFSKYKLSWRRLGWFHSNTCLHSVACKKSQKLQFMLKKKKSHHTHSLITNDFILHTSVGLFRVDLVWYIRKVKAVLDELKLKPWGQRFRILSRLDILLGAQPIFSCYVVVVACFDHCFSEKKCRKKNN